METETEGRPAFVTSGGGRIDRATLVALVLELFELGAAGTLTPEAWGALRDSYKPRLEALIRRMR